MSARGSVARRAGGDRRPRSRSPARRRSCSRPTRSDGDGRPAQHRLVGRAEPEPACAHRGRRGARRRPDLRRRRLHLDRRHHRARSSATTSPPTAGGACARLPIAVNHPGRHRPRRPRLRARRQPRRRRRPRAQVQAPLPLQPAARPLDAPAGRPERPRARSAWSRSTTSSTPPVATTRPTSACGRSRSTTPSAGAGPRAAPMPTGRNHVGAAVLDGDLVVTGGRPGDVNGGMTTVERYDPDADRWSTAARRSARRAADTPPSSPAARLVVFGGEELAPGRADDRAGRGLRPGLGEPGRRCRRWSPRATGSAASPAAGACTRSRAARSPGSPTRARSSTSTCPRRGSAVRQRARLALAREAALGASSATRTTARRTAGSPRCRPTRTSAARPRR